MNKYQREKVKRMKKLSNLGISYYFQKKLLRNYSFQQLDIVIEKANIIKRSGILGKTIEVLIKAGSALIRAIKKR